MKKIIPLFLTIFISSCITSQEFDVPLNAKFETQADYMALEKDVLKAIDWLMETPIDEKEAKRKDISAFLYQWTEGSPYITVVLNTGILTFIDRDRPDFFMMFICGWLKFSIESKDYENEISGNMAGIEMLIKFYEKNKHIISNDERVEKYIEMKKNGTLKKYIETEVKGGVRGK